MVEVTPTLSWRRGGVEDRGDGGDATQGGALFDCTAKLLSAEKAELQERLGTTVVKGADNLLQHLMRPQEFTSLLYNGLPRALVPMRTISWS